MNLQIPTPISGGLILSYRCTASCRHCMYACSPRWSAEWISEADLEAILQSLAGKIEPSPWGAATMSLNHGLHFTGGEPFLNFPLLCNAVRRAKELGIPSLFVETNCYWAKTDRGTREKLEVLREHGLIGIMISINPFYLEYVPFERSERAIRIAQEVFGVNVAVYQLEHYRTFKRLGIRGRLPIPEFLKIKGGGKLTRNTEFFLSGRAPYEMEEFDLFPKYPAESLFLKPCSPAFIRSWHNHFDSYGNFMPGYCGGLSLGDCRCLDELLVAGIDLDSRPLLSYIIADNFEGLLGFAKEHGYREREYGYLSKCHLCMELRKFLVRAEDFAELAPREFYDQLESG
ncbi:MAG: 4Fe-4S cluster-binding domain-containing protein [Spirochaetaceae bacterium]|nr:MAG: 4Fe-4S cluster-binding domain-containing protein [Spirochaetaceae bacterium]